MSFVDGGGEDACVVCGEERSTTRFPTLLPCDHARLCRSCARSWLLRSPTCPLCRCVVVCVAPLSSLVPSSSDSSDSDSDFDDVRTALPPSPPPPPPLSHAFTPWGATVRFLLSSSSSSFPSSSFSSSSFQVVRKDVLLPVAGGFPNHVGITLSDLNGPVSRPGVEVLALSKQDAGWKGGLRKGDVLVALNGVPVSSHANAVRIIDEAVLLAFDIHCRVLRPERKRGRRSGSSRMFRFPSSTLRVTQAPVPGDVFLGRA